MEINGCISQRITISKQKRASKYLIKWCVLCVTIWCQVLKYFIILSTYLLRLCHWMSLICHFKPLVSIILKTEAVRIYSSETFVFFSKSTWHHLQEEHFHILRCENLRSYILKLFLSARKIYVGQASIWPHFESLKKCLASIKITSSWKMAWTPKDRCYIRKIVDKENRKTREDIFS